MNYELDKDYLELDINIKIGDITILDSETDQLEVEFDEIRRNTLEELVLYSFEDNVLKIRDIKRTKDQGKVRIFNFGNNLPETSVTIKIPKNVRTKGFIKASTGDIEIENLSFIGAIKVVSGDVSIKNLSMHGIPELEDCPRILNLDAISGDISIENSDLKGFNIKSISGDVDIEGVMNLEEDCKIDSISGDIDLKARECKTDKKINITTISGDIESSEILNDIIIKKSKVRDGARSKISLIDAGSIIKSTLGAVFSSIGELKKELNEDIEIKVKSSDEKKSKEKAHDKEIKQILEMLSEGIITVEESERLIKAIKE